MNRTFSEATVRRYPARITNSCAITSLRSSMLTSSASDRNFHKVSHYPQDICKAWTDNHGQFR
jgi:hypothetical protein